MHQRCARLDVPPWKQGGQEGFPNFPTSLPRRNPENRPWAQTMPECRFNKSSAPPSSLAMNVTIIVVRRVNIDRSIPFRAAQKGRRRRRRSPPHQGHTKAYTIAEATTRRAVTRLRLRLVWLLLEGPEEALTCAATAGVASDFVSCSFGACSDTPAELLVPASTH